MGQKIHKGAERRDPAKGSGHADRSEGKKSGRKRQFSSGEEGRWLHT